MEHKFITVVKDNFNRVNLIEANNSLHNYDLIAVNETCINDTVEIPEVLLENYTFINSNSSTNTRRGGVGLFYRNNLPLKVRNDLSLPECIVVELKIKLKSLFILPYIAVLRITISQSSLCRKLQKSLQ